MRKLQQLAALVAVALAQRVCAETLVVIANPSIAVRQLSGREVIDIYFGRSRTFPSGEPAIPVDLDIASPERKQFYLMLAHRDSLQMSSYWARATLSGIASRPFAVTDQRMAVDMVANNRNAIAYVERSLVDNRVRIVLEITQ